MRPAKVVALVFLGLALLTTPRANGTQPGEADGWYKWQVDGDLITGSSCCFSGKRNGEPVAKTTCELDGGFGNIISDCVDGSSHSVIYVRQLNGSPSEIRVLDAGCTVSSSAAVADMGTIPVQEGIDLLLDIVKSKQLRMSVRESALFWLAQTDSDAAFEFFDHLLSET